MRLLEPYDAHIVVTARDPARQVVADWQESVKHGRSQGFEMYLKRGGVGEGEEGKPGSNTFRAQRLPEVLDRWGGGLPADRVHVVTVPPPGATRGCCGSASRACWVSGIPPGSGPAPPSGATSGSAWPRSS
jgi:hypothetical protein